MSQIHHLILLLNETTQTSPPPPTLSTTIPSTGSQQQTNTPVAQIHNMLLYVSTELTIQETEKAVSNWQASASPSLATPSLPSSPSKTTLPLPKSKPMQLLYRIGVFLESIFRTKLPVSRIVSKDVIGKGSRYLFDEVCKIIFIYNNKLYQICAYLHLLCL